MKKNKKLHHSVTENGKLQVRIIFEYVDDNNVIKERITGDPYTPADTDDMIEWDDRSKDIVEAITNSDIITNFESECQHMHGEGIETCVSYDRVVGIDGEIAVRRITRIFDDGEEISKKYHRTWVLPTMTDFTNVDVMSKAVAKKIHTPEIIASYKDKIKASTPI